MIHIVRDERTGRIKGTTKIPPAWATERDLRHVLLMPAIRQLVATLSYYRDGRKAEEVMRESGFTRAALMTLLVRTRKGLGITREPNVAQARRGGARQRIPAKHDQFRDGFSLHPAPWNSRGRRYHPTIDEKQLQDFFLRPAMQRYEIARAFWVEGLTSGEVAANLGIKKKAVEFQLSRIKRVMSHPLQRIQVLCSITRTGEKRDGVTATYKRRPKAQTHVVQDRVSVDRIEV